jgi:hypothetical protein
MNRSSLLPALAICSLTLLVTSGCNSGPPVGRVNGTVTMDDQPLGNALVTFVPQSGGQSALGKTDATGKYSLYRRGEPGAVVGMYTIVVTTMPDPAAAVTDVPTDSDAYEQQATGGSARDYNQATVKESIPARYNTSSELTHEVTKWTNQVDLALTST